MGKKVEELVEWVAECVAFGWAFDEPHEAIDFKWSLVTEGHRINAYKVAKQILSHKDENGEPDLALIDQTCFTYKETGKELAYVIPLAEALKEEA